MRICIVVKQHRIIMICSRDFIIHLSHKMSLGALFCYNDYFILLTLKWYTIKKNRIMMYNISQDKY